MKTMKVSIRASNQVSEGKYTTLSTLSQSLLLEYALPYNFHPVSSSTESFTCLGGKYGYDLWKLHAEA